ncbi:MAG: hypothetical protein HY901_10680 [Deltaproteobacteria bacterium]|nr:hypothetical protein [Deltaproteobacteria bacterium]
MSDTTVPVAPVANTTPTEEKSMPASVTPINVLFGSLVALDDASMRVIVDKFLGEAEEEEFPILLKCRDPELAARNAAEAAAAINQPEILARISEELPKVNIEQLVSVGHLGHSVAFEARRDTGVGSRLIRATAKRAGELRKMLLPQIEVLVIAGICPKAEYDQLKSAKGTIATGTALSDIVEFLDSKATDVEGKVALDKAVIVEAKAVGKFIRDNVKLPNQRKNGQPGERRAARQQDLLYTLLVHRYEELRAVAHWLWRKDADTYAPPLQAKVRVKAKKDATTKNEATEPQATQPASNAVVMEPATQPTVSTAEPS